MELFSVVSGSSGNCICIGDDSTHLMIDAGISGKRIEAGLNEMDLTTSDMKALLITHEHSDHIGGVGVLARRYGLPIYGTFGTIQAIRNSKTLGNIDEGLFHVVRPDEDFQIGNLTVTPFSISHDAADPVAYTVRDDRAKVAVCTDTGMYNDYIISHLKGVDALLLEANHDIHMLEVGSYPYPLKQRILSDHGHLSNEASGQLLTKVLHDDMKHILLGHLSQENNYPDLAYETVKLEVTMGDCPYKGNDFPIEVARRDRVSTRVIV